MTLHLSYAEEDNIQIPACPLMYNEEYFSCRAQAKTAFAPCLRSTRMYCHVALSIHFYISTCTLLSIDKRTGRVLLPPVWNIAIFQIAIVHSLFFFLLHLTHSLLPQVVGINIMQ